MTSEFREGVVVISCCLIAIWGIGCGGDSAGSDPGEAAATDQCRFDEQGNWVELPEDLDCTEEGPAVTVGDPCEFEGGVGELANLRCKGGSWRHYFIESDEPRSSGRSYPATAYPCEPGERLPAGYECIDPTNPAPPGP